MAHQVVRINSEGIVDGAGVFPLVGVPAAFVFTDTGVNVDGAQLIPLQPVNSQQLTITLNSQNCTFLIYTKHIWVPFVPTGGVKTDPPIYEPIDPIFLDLYINDSLLVGGVLCLNQNLIVHNAYFGFVGDLSFIDTQGNEDPKVSGLGSRWQLAYWPNILF